MNSRDPRRPLLVFALPKVGNTSVIDALKRSGLEVERAHFLSDRHFWRALARLQLEGSEQRIQEMLAWNSRFRKRAVRGFEGQGCDIVTLVRDPLARTVSYFFETSSMKDPTVRREWDEGRLGVEAIVERFMARDDHFAPLSWFEDELQTVFSIDVYATPFPRERGYQVYRHGKTRALLIRLEDLSRCGPPALGELLGIEGAELTEQNVRSRSETADLYRTFLRELCLPREYVDRMYDSRMARHFYSAEELDGFRHRWRVLA